MCTKSPSKHNSVLLALSVCTKSPNKHNYVLLASVERGMKGQELVNEVVMEWERVVNSVAKCELGEKMIVCGRAARWWDEQIKDRINARREVYRKVVNGRENLWDEYCRLRKEVKQLVIEKKLNNYLE